MAQNGGILSGIEDPQDPVWHVVEDQSCSRLDHLVFGAV